MPITNAERRFSFALAGLLLVLLWGSAVRLAADTFHLTNTGVPAVTVNPGSQLVTTTTGNTGFFPTMNLSSGTVAYWYSDPLYGSFPGSLWTITIYSSMPACSAVVQAEVGYCNPDGSGYVSMGSQAIDYNQQSGNHPNVYSLSLPFANLTNQRLRLTLSWVSGCPVTICYNDGSYFDSRISSPALGPNGTATWTPTVTPSPTVTNTPEWPISKSVNVSSAFVNDNVVYTLNFKNPNSPGGGSCADNFETYAPGSYPGAWSAPYEGGSWTVSNSSGNGPSQPGSQVLDAQLPASPGAPGAYPHILLTCAGAVTDGSIQADVKLLSSGGQLTLLWRQHDSSAYQIHIEAGGAVTLRIVVNGGFQEVSTLNIPGGVQLNTWYTLVLSVVGFQLSGSINGMALPSITDTNSTYSSGAAGLEIDDPARTGIHAQFDNVVVTLGAQNWANVILTDTLPAGLTYVSDSCGGSASGQVVSIPVGSLPAGSSRSCQVTARVSSCPATLVNKASLYVVNPVPVKQYESNSVSTTVQCGTRTPTPPPSPTASPSSTASPSFTASPTLSPSPTASPSSTHSPTRTATPSASPSSSASPTATPSATPSATATYTPSPSATPTASPSSTSTWTPSATPSLSPSPSHSPTATPSATPTLSPSRTASPTPSPSASPSATGTHSPTLTASPTSTSSASPSATSTYSPTLTPSPTSTSSASPTATATLSPSLTSSPTSSPSATPTLTSTASPSASPSPSQTLTASPSSTSSATPSLSASPTASPQASPTSTATATPSLSPSPSLTASPSSTPTPTDSPSLSSSPTASPSASETASATASPSLSASPSSTPSCTESATPSDSPSSTPSPTQSSSESPTPSATDSPTLTETPSPSRTPTASASATASPSATLSYTPSPSSTSSSSPTASYTVSPSPTASPTARQSPSFTVSPSPSATPSRTPTFSPSPSMSPSPSYTASPSISPTPQPMPILVEAAVFNSAGEKVAELYRGGASGAPSGLSLNQASLIPGISVANLPLNITLANGLNSLGWDGLTDLGLPASAGIYYLQVNSTDAFGQTTTNILPVQVLASAASYSVQLGIYNSAGERVASVPVQGCATAGGLKLLNSEVAAAGGQVLKVEVSGLDGRHYEISWDGTGESGEVLTPGSYTAALQSRSGVIYSEAFVLLAGPGQRPAAPRIAPNPVPAGENRLRVLCPSSPGLRWSAELYTLTGDKLDRVEGSGETLDFPLARIAPGLLFVRATAKDEGGHNWHWLLKGAVLR